MSLCIFWRRLSFDFNPARAALTCQKCRIKMIEKKRSYHKKRKWICPQCGAARMQQQKPREQRGKGEKN